MFTFNPVHELLLFSVTIAAGDFASVSGVLVYPMGTLVIEDVREEHAGRYSCIARNMVAAATVSATLYVQCKLWPQGRELSRKWI